MPQADPPNWHFHHEFRVQYHETDGQRRVHHANYIKYFERGRVEMLRAGGIRYKSLEDRGLLLVVTEMNIRYFAPAEFDDLLSLTTTVTKIGKVRISHAYEITLQEDRTHRIVSADSVIACVDPAGKPKRLPEQFFRKM